MLRRLLLSLVVALFAVSVHAADGNWNVDANGSWGTGTNWLTGLIPNAAGDRAFFSNNISAARTITFDGTRTVGTLRFGDSDNTAAFTFSAVPTGGYLLFSDASGTALLENTSQLAITNTITCPMVLNSNLRIALSGASTGTHPFNGAITNGANGPKSVIIDANGTHPPTVANTTGQAAFNGFNTFSGGLTIDQVRLTANNAFSLGTGTVTVLDGGQPFFPTAGVYNNNFVLNGLGWNETTHGQLGTIRSDGNTTLNGTITLNTNARIAGNGAAGVTTILNGVIGETSPGKGVEFGRWVPLNGAGMLSTFVINHSTTATGQVTISSGTLRVGNGSTLGDINSFSSLAFGRTNTSSEAASAATLAFNRSDNYNFTRAVTETLNQLGTRVVGNVTHSGTGVLTWDNGANGFTGTTTVNAVSNSAKMVFGTGGAYVFTGGAITLSGGADLEFNTSSNNTLGGTINGAANSYLINSGGGTLTIAGATDNPNARVQVNAGTVVLGKTSTAAIHSVTAPADFGLIVTGGTAQLAGSGDDQINNNTGVRMSGGTLDLNGTAEQIDALSGTGGTILNNSAVASTFTVGATNSVASVNNGVLFSPPTFGGVIQNGTGPVALTKTGTGTQALSGVNTYTGDTTINGGTLAVLGGLSTSGQVNVNGGILAGTGPVGSVTMTSAAGSGIRPGGLGVDTANGTLTMAALTVNGGDIRLGDGDSITVTGAVNFAAPSTITLVPSSILPLGNKTLLTATGALNITTMPTLVIPGTPRSAYALAQAGNSLNLVVSGTVGKSLIWNGATNGLWDVNNSANFEIGEKFFTFDAVRFLEFPTANTTITLATGLQPSFVLVDNDSGPQGGPDYTFQSGSLAGAMTLHKDGAGTLNLNTANTFSGDVEIDGGILKVGNAAALGDTNGRTKVTSVGTLDVNGFNLGSESILIEGAGKNGAGALINTGAQQVNATRFITLTNDATVGGTGRFDIRVTTGGEVLDLAGRTLTKVGANQFSVVGVRVTDGNMVANAGNLSLETTSIVQGTGTITYNPGSIAQFYQNPAGNVTRNMVWNGNFVENVGQNHTINSNVSMTGDVTLQGTGGTVTWAGNITESGGARAVTKTGTSAYILAGNTAYTGATTVNAGTLQLGGGNATTLPQPSRFDINGGLANLSITGNHTYSGKPINISPTAGGEFRWTGATQNSTLTLALNGPVGGSTTNGTFSVFSGTVNLDSGSNLSANVVRVGMTSHNTNNIGTLNILAGSTITALNYYVGESAAGLTGIVNQSGGDVTVTGTDTSADGNFRMGHWSGQGSTYNMSGGTLNVPNATTTIGIDGVQPAFNISGGTVNMFRLLVDGRGATPPIGGLLNLSGGTLAIGGGGLGTTGNAIVTVTGGTLKAGAASSWTVGMNFDTPLGTLDTNGFEVIFTGAANGPGGFIKAGAGTLAMTNTASNVYGTIAVNAGTLTLQGTTGTLNGPVTINTGAGATLAVAAPNALSHPGSTINANNGGTVVTLFPNASTVAIGSVKVNSGGVLSGIGSFGNVSALAGGSIRPGVAEGQIGTLTLNSLVSTGGNFRFNLNPTIVTTGAGVNDFIILKETADFTGGGTITPVFNGLPTPGNVYTLFSAATLTGLPTIDTASLSSRYTYVIGAVGSSVTLTVNAGPGQPLTWTGSQSALWNVNLASNWLNAVSAADKFQQIDAVTFNDSTAVNNVTLVNVLQPSQVTVEAMQNYTFSGTGSIESGTLIKNNTGTLILPTNNSFTNVNINGGTVQVGTGGTTGAIGGAIVNFTGGTLAYNRSDNFSQSFANQYNGPGAVSFDGGAVYGLLVNTSTYSGGTTLINGTLSALFSSTGNPPNSGPFGTGVITLGSPATGNKATALLLGNSADISNAIVVSADGTGAVTIGASNNNAGVANATTFLGPVTLNRNTTFFSPFGIDRLSLEGRITGPVGTLTVTGSGRTTVSSTANDFAGDIVITGVGSVLQASVATAGETIPNGSSVTVNAAAAFQLAGSANSFETINALKGAGNVTRNVAALQTLIVGAADGTGTFTGSILNGTGVVGLNKIGTGTQTLGGTYSATGRLTVDGGVLEVTSTNIFGGGVGVSGRPAVKVAAAEAVLDTTITTTGSTADLSIGMSIAGTGIPANSRIVDIPTATTMTINTTQTATLAGNLTFGAAPLTLNNGGIFRYNAVSATDDRVVNLGLGGGEIGVTPAGTTLSLSGTVAGGNVLFKSGPGTLALTGANTFTGGATVNAGTLSFTGVGTAINANTNIFTANTGGTISFGRNDVFGNHVAAGLSPIMINPGGTLTNSGNFFNALGPVTMAGGTITSVGGANANFPAYAFKAPVTYSGTALATIANAGPNSGIALGEDAVTSVVFDVADGLPGTDLRISAPLSDGRNGFNTAFQPGALAKAGPGTLELSGVNTYTGATTVDAGTLVVNGSTAAGSAVTVNLGAFLRGTNTAAGTGTVNGIVFATGTVWPGSSEKRPALTVTEKLNVGSVDFSAGGKLATILKYNGGTGISQVLTVTGAGASVTLGGTSQLSFAADAAAVQTDYLVLDASAGTGFTTAFKTLVVTGLTLGTQYDVAYKSGPADAAPILQSTLGGNTTLASAKNQVYIRLIAATPTPVTIEGFRAAPDGAGTLISWTSISEFQNAGFNVYRRAFNESQQEPRPQGSGWTRVNPALIAGRVTNADSKQYTLYDWARPGVYEYKMESVSIRGDREEYRALAGPVALDAVTVNASGVSSYALAAASVSIDHALGGERQQKLAAEFGKLATPFNAERALSIQQATGMARSFDGSLVLPAGLREISARDGTTDAPEMRPTEVAARSASDAVSSAGASAAAGARWFSARVSRAGSYTGAKVTYTAPGVLRIPQAALPAGFDARRVSIQREGRPLTALAIDAGDLIVFAPGYEDDYTNKDALFLRKMSGATPAGSVTHASGLFASAQTVNVDSPATVTTSYRDVYFDFDLRPYTFAPWFSSQYLTGGTVQRFSIDAPSATSGPVSLSVNLWSLTQVEGASSDHALQVFVNRQPAGQAVWSGGNKMLQLSFQLAAGTLKAGLNQVELSTPIINGVDSQIALLHSMSIGYTRSIDASKPLDVFNLGTSPKLFEAASLPSAAVWVVDTRYPDRAALVAHETQAQPNGTFKLRFTANGGGTGRYLIVPAGRENAPLSVSKRQIRAAKPAAYLAVGPAQFSAGVQPLLRVRAKEGLRGAFADQEQIFDYYNHGRYGPAGIRNAVRSVRPQYLLLLGRTTYDYRDYSGLAVDPLCPTFLTPTAFWAQATSDSMFGDLGRGYPEVAVGRLPVNNAGELSAAVQHVLGNRALATGWRVHAVADRFDAEAGDFASEADAIAQTHPEMAWQRNYLGLTHQSSPEVTSALKDAANGGADMILYVGHGNAVRLGKDDPRILDTKDVQEWTGNVVFLQSTCTANWMAKNESGYKSVAIQALTQPQGGISASIASSTYMNSHYATEFMSQLLANTGTTKRWGDALLKTQQWAHGKGGASGYYADLGRTEQIFGDPAMPIGAAK